MLGWDVRSRWLIEADIAVVGMPFHNAVFGVPVTFFPKVAGSVPKLGGMLNLEAEHPLPALSQEACYGLEA
jgi:hypothetical protein